MLSPNCQRTHKLQYLRLTSEASSVRAPSLYGCGVNSECPIKSILSPITQWWRMSESRGRQFSSREEVDCSERVCMCGCTLNIVIWRKITLKKRNYKFQDRVESTLDMLITSLAIVLHDDFPHIGSNMHILPQMLTIHCEMASRLFPPRWTSMISGAKSPRVTINVKHSRHVARILRNASSHVVFH